MDVHINNNRFCSQKCDIIVHVFLPSIFLEDNQLPRNRNLIFSAQTRFFDNRKPPSAYIQVWGKFHNDEISFRNLHTLKSGIGVSLPLFLEDDGTYQPYNILVLRAIYIGKPKVHYIYFYYLTLLEGLKRATQVLMETETTGTKPDTETEENTLVNVNPLNEILQAVKEDINDNISPLGVLSNLLQYRPNNVFKHHQALEDPGGIRGQSEMPENNQKVIQNEIQEGNVKVTLNSLTSQKKDCVTYPVYHSFSQHKFYICVYSGLLNKPLEYTSAIDNMPRQELYWINPLSVVLSETTFLEKIQHAFVDSLEQACNHQNYIIHQKLPIIIENTNNTASFIHDHFLESCFTLRQHTSETSAWIKAALSLNGGGTNFWLDIFNLWESGDDTLGVELFEDNPQQPYKYAASPEPSWSALFRNKTILTVIRRAATACVLVHRSLQAWLLLPGGFAIKGYYTLTEDDLNHIHTRYGAGKGRIENISQ